MKGLSLHSRKILWATVEIVIWVGAFIALMLTAKPAHADVTIHVQGAAVRYRCWMDGWQHYTYEARREVAITYDQCVAKFESTVCLVPYGAVTCDAAGWADWSARFTTEVGLQIRYSHGVCFGTELHVHGRSRDDVYDDAMPGGEWMSAGIASTIQSDLRHWAIGEWNPPPISFGCEGGSGLLVNPVLNTTSGVVDNLFQWWLLHGITDTPFVPFALEIGEDVAEVEHGRTHISTSIRDNNGIPYQPPTWTVCRERADITIRIPGLEEVSNRECGDFNNDGVKTVPDLFSFLSAWFAEDARADRTGDAYCEFEDVAIFLGEWFAGV